MAFENGVGNRVTLEMHITLTVSRLSYVCSVTISEAKVYISPLLLSCCYRAINGEKQYSERKTCVFRSSLLSSTV